MRALRTIVTALFLAMAMAGCAYTQTLPPVELFVQKVVEVPGASKERILEKIESLVCQNLQAIDVRMGGAEQQENRYTV